MNCPECDTPMNKIGGPSFQKIYACPGCHKREVREVSSTDANVDHVEDSMLSRMWGKFSKKYKDDKNN
jgi:transposase-like protein